MAFIRSDELGVRLIAGQIVTRFEDVFSFKPQWLSRSEILYTADGYIKRRSVRTLPQVIPFHAKVSLARPSYTAVHRVLEPSEPQRLAGIVSPAVSPDGTKVAFAALGDLWVMAIGEHPIRVTDDPFIELDPAWSPDSFKLAFASDRKGNMDLWVHDFRARIAVPIRQEEDTGRVSGIAWSPDGTQIGYLLDRTGVMSLPAPGELASCHHTHRVISHGSPSNDWGRMTWGPDNCTVAMGALFRGARGSGLNQAVLYSFDRDLFSPDLLFPGHSVGDRRNSGPVWAPDGLKMAFVSEGKLWVVPVDAGGKATDAPRVIAEDFPDAPSWQGDSRRLVYMTPNGLRRVPAEGGFSQPITVDLGWAPSRPPRRVVVHAGELFDGRNQFLRGQTDLIIENGIIVDISPHDDALHAGAVVDAGDETVMPGFIETRTHLDPTFGEVLGRIWLAYGITSVRDVSLNPYVGLEQREAIANGRRVGPRVFIAGDSFDGAACPSGPSRSSTPRSPARRCSALTS
ncbi:MAG: hypothetical protein DMF91_26315 [Acidobacteria bacterium]|nr:MAG: hypothetical protein DMF91_26315 [Acidobacteriota bacterium]